jgi:ABC-type amino acid transport system permease subunit
MSRAATYRDIVVPQVFRVVLPSFGNQYISLAKTTSLGIAIGFPDLFNVYGTVANQSGRSLEGVIVVMLAYLTLSWCISAVVNWANSRLLQAGGHR